MNIGKRAMRFDPFRYLAKLEKRHPALSRFLAMRVLGFMAPFNAHLGAKMLEWNDNTCVIAVRRIRGVRNHVKGIHAGALFTLGETCAGLVIIRNFPFAQYRPLMSDVKAHYEKQARDDVTGICEVSAQTIEFMKVTMEAGEIPFVEVVTRIRNMEGEEIATVTTTWQVKPWGMVRTASA